MTCTSAAMPRLSFRLSFLSQLATPVLACPRPPHLQEEPDYWLLLAALVLYAAGKFAMHRPH